MRGESTLTARAAYASFAAASTALASLTIRSVATCGNTNGCSSTYLDMGFANVRAGTQKRRGEHPFVLLRLGLDGPGARGRFFLPEEFFSSRRTSTTAARFRSTTSPAISSRTKRSRSFLGSSPVAAFVFHRAREGLDQP